MSAVSAIFTHLSEKYERYPLVVGNHLSIFRVVPWYGFGPGQVVGVLDPTVAGHELGVGAGEMYRCPARDWVAYILQT